MGTVLVVDDDEASRQLMCVELRANYDVIDSGKPEEGLALALENKPDAILLDLRMPKYSGYELLQTFTAFSRTKMIPVVIVSGETSGQTKEQCKKLGAAGFFEKPLDFDSLRACLRQIVRKRQHIQRSEVRVKLGVALKLRGMDSRGKSFELVGTTEEVSVSGFLCRCAAELPVGVILDVHLSNHGDVHVGKARIIHSSHESESIWHCGCRFIEKSGPWVLQ